jgi:phosphoribosyl 1,2-cyclic phosphodiesterase
MLTVCSIASGSNGNCYYIGNNNEALLIDAGISARRIITRLQQQNLEPGKIKAVFLSHEHADHASGARVLGKKLNIPVYVTSKTYMALYGQHKPLCPRFFDPGHEILIGSFQVFPFLKKHDAAQPCSFRVVYEGIHTGVFTDIGSACVNVVHHIRQCHILFLEANYDEKMLWDGRYPWPLKNRIASEYGHLSNDQAFELLLHNSGSQLTTVFLSHLSAENNTPDKAMERFHEMRNRLNIRITSRYDAGEVVQFNT